MNSASIRTGIWILVALALIFACLLSSSTSAQNEDSVFPRFLRGLNTEDIPPEILDDVNLTGELAQEIPPGAPVASSDYDADPEVTKRLEFRGGTIPISTIVQENPEAREVEVVDPLESLAEEALAERGLPYRSPGQPLVGRARSTRKRYLQDVLSRREFEEKRSLNVWQHMQAMKEEANSNDQ